MSGLSARKTLHLIAHKAEIGQSFEGKNLRQGKQQGAPEAPLRNEELLKTRF
jgi:hypothetical protein